MSNTPADLAAFDTSALRQRLAALGLDPRTPADFAILSAEIAAFLHQLQNAASTQALLLDDAQGRLLDDVRLGRLHLVEIVAEQKTFSEVTFGPGRRTLGLVEHIRKELDEILAAPEDTVEWIDVALLALDGAWRTGAEPLEVARALREKLERNKQRLWPDWRTKTQDEAITHVKPAEPVSTTLEGEGPYLEAEVWARVNGSYERVVGTATRASEHPTEPWDFRLHALGALDAALVDFSSLTLRRPRRVSVLHEDRDAAWWRKEATANLALLRTTEAKLQYLIDNSANLEKAVEDTAGNIAAENVRLAAQVEQLQADLAAAKARVNEAEAVNTRNELEAAAVTADIVGRMEKDRKRIAHLLTGVGHADVLVAAVRREVPLDLDVALARFTAWRESLHDTTPPTFTNPEVVAELRQHAQRRAQDCVDVAEALREAVNNVVDGDPARRWSAALRKFDEGSKS